MRTVSRKTIYADEYQGSALFLRRMPCASEPKNLLIFGSGAQAEAHASVFLRLWSSLEKVTFVIRRPTARSASLLISMTHAFPKVQFAVGVPSRPDAEDRSVEPGMRLDLQRAVHEANVILTATSSTASLFNSVDVTSGTRIVLIGSYKPHMREVEDELIRRAGIVVVDSREACAREAGELISAGVPGEQLAELGELLRDDHSGSSLLEKVRKAGDVAIFKSVSRSVVQGPAHQTLYSCIAGRSRNPRCRHRGSCPL